MAVEANFGRDPLLAPLVYWHAALRSRSQEQRTADEALPLMHLRLLRGNLSGSQTHARCARLHRASLPLRCSSLRPQSQCSRPQATKIGIDVRALLAGMWCLVVSRQSGSRDRRSIDSLVLRTAFLHHSHGFALARHSSPCSHSSMSARLGRVSRVKQVLNGLLSGWAVPIVSPLSSPCRLALSSVVYNKAEVRSQRISHHFLTAGAVLPVILRAAVHVCVDRRFSLRSLLVNSCALLGYTGIGNQRDWSDARLKKSGCGALHLCRRNDAVHIFTRFC